MCDAMLKEVRDPVRSNPRMCYSLLHGNAHRERGSRRCL